MKYPAIFAVIFLITANALGQTVDMETILGDLTIPPASDISQKFPYGVIQKTPPSLTPINYAGQKPHHKYRMALRVFQGCPHIEITKGGRLWATWFGSNIQAERVVRNADNRPYMHADQFAVIATSGDDGKSWKEVFVFDPSALFNASSSDPMLWKDSDGRLRFVCVRNMELDDNSMHDKSAWEFTALNPEDLRTQWSAPRFLGTKNISVMKPLVFPDGSVLRPMDDFADMCDKSSPRIRFLKEDKDGRPIFLSQVSDKDATFAEQMPIVRRDGSLFSFFRTARGQKFMTSPDGGRNWNIGGFYHKQFSIDTKCFLKKLASGRVLLIANDVQCEGEGKNRKYFHCVSENGVQVRRDSKSARERMTAYLSYDDGKTFPHKILLNASQTSYPSAAEDSKGNIYIVFDQGRATSGQQGFGFVKSGKPTSRPEKSCRNRVF